MHSFGSAIMKHTIIAAAVSVLFPASIPAMGATYLPLDDGNQWSYAAVGGGGEDQTVTGTFTILGRETSVIQYTNSDMNNGLTNFWSTGIDGDVLLHGFFRVSDAFGWVYDPPVRIVEAPLAVGQSWSQTFDVLDYETLTYVTTITIDFLVYDEGVITVPAGDFYSFGIGENVLAGALPASFALTGEADEARGGSASDWWCDGLGRSQYDSFDRYQLASSNLPTPVDYKTWGRIKELYR
jgi:hypothetical protein